MPWTLTVNEPYLIANWLCIFSLLEMEFLKMLLSSLKSCAGRENKLSLSRRFLYWR